MITDSDSLGKLIWVVLQLSSSWATRVESVGVTRTVVLLGERLQPVTTVLSIDDVPIRGMLWKRQVHKLLYQERHICFSLLPQY